MHIPDGFLQHGRRGGVLGADGRRAWRSPSARTNGRLDERRVPLLGVTAAFIFAAQMLNFPVAGGTSGHFLGAALAAMLLGPWLACLVMAVVIATQAFFFADGGVTALGANILNMGMHRRARRRLRACSPRGAILPQTGPLVPRRRGRRRVGSRSCSAPTATAVELALSDTVPLATVLPRCSACTR